MSCSLILAGLRMAALPEWQTRTLDLQGRTGSRARYRAFWTGNMVILIRVWVHL